MISHEHRCIFVHIPKTAGNSINRVFGVGWENHKDLQRYHAETQPEAFETYFKFAIVRNPWDRLFSDYNYQKKKSREKASKLFMFSEQGRVRDFAEWVETALATPDFYEPGRWGGEVSTHVHRWSPQVDWLEVDGVSRIDYVAHLENLSLDFRTVCRRVGLPEVRLPHRNRRLHWHYSHYYDRTTRDIVANYYARDVARFGYQFERTALSVAMRWPFAARARTESTRPVETVQSVSTALAAVPPRNTTIDIPSTICGSDRNLGDSAASAPSVAVLRARPTKRITPPIWRRHSSALVAVLALVVAAFAYPMLDDDDGPDSRALVSSVVRRNYADTTNSRAPSPNDPFYQLVQRVAHLDFDFVPLANGSFAIIPLSTPTPPPQAPALYGSLPNPGTSAPPPTEPGHGPFFHRRFRRS